jgi:CBS domain-containing protein
LRPIRLALESTRGCNVQVRDVLNAKSSGVVTIEPDATVSEAIGRLVQNNIGSLPVLDADNRLVGVFSERDVLRGIHNHGERFARMRISDVMTPNPVTVAPDTDVEEVMGKMTERRIAKIPVMQEDRLVGIISVGDVIKMMYERVNSENQYLLCYIHGAV